MDSPLPAGAGPVDPATMQDLRFMDETTSASRTGADQGRDRQNGDVGPAEEALFHHHLNRARQTCLHETEHALGEKYPQSRGLAASYLRNRHGFSLNPLLRAVSYNIGADHLAPSRGDPDGIDGEAPSFEFRRCETLQSLGA
jgi:hypothetical protein